MAVSPEEAARALLARARREVEALEARRATLRDTLGPMERMLRDEYGATRVWLFGSLVWGGFHADSDLDVAVEGLEPIDLGVAMAEASAICGALVELFRLEEPPRPLPTRVLQDGESWP